MKSKTGNKRLSDTLTDYYNGPNKKRFNNYLKDLGVSHNLTDIEREVNKVFWESRAKLLAGYESQVPSSIEVKTAAKKAFANYVYHSYK